MFSDLPVVDEIFDAWLVIASILIVNEFIRQKCKLNLLLIMIIIFSGIILTVTWQNSGDMFDSIICSVSSIAAMMLVEISLRKKCFDDFLDISVLVVWIIVIANVFTVVYYPDGILLTTRGSPIWLYGIDNRFAFLFMPGICLAFVRDLFKSQKLKTSSVLLYAICLATLVFRWSVGAMVAMTLFIPFFLFIYKIKKPKLFHGVNYYIVFLILYMALTYYNMQYYFEGLIVDYLQKDLTLTYRTVLWEMGLYYINLKPFLGYGVLGNAMMISIFGFSHLHNHLLNIIFQTGYVGLAVYVVILLIPFIKLTKYKYNNVAKVVAFSIFALLIMLLVDTYDIKTNIMFFMIAIGGNIDKIMYLQDNLNHKQQSTKPLTA